MIYLDTHIVIWLALKEFKLLSKQSKDLIEQNDLFVSPIVFLELQYLLEVEKIIKSPTKILQDLKDEINLKVCEKDFHTVIQESLKQKWTRDPFDRIITAQAAMDKNIVLTKDASILKNYRMAKW